MDSNTILNEDVQAWEGVTTMCYNHGLPVTSYGLTLDTELLLYGNAPDIALGAPLCLLLAHSSSHFASEGP
jgi:hypothetical protein